MNTITFIRFALSSMACASLASAQTNETRTFREAIPPAGVVKGIMKAGNRCGVLIVGGKMAFSNDTFTLITRGHKVKWQVLEVTDNKSRFAREVSESESTRSPPLDCPPNFSELVMLLEESARSYNDASTRLQKDDVMAKTHKIAQSWCTNDLLCIKATLSDVSMAKDGIALLRLCNIDRGPFDAIAKPFLHVNKSSDIKVMVPRERALSYKSGYSVILSGRPKFRPGAETPLVDELTKQGTFALFRMLSDFIPIGSLDLTDIKFDIFDPKVESVQQQVRRR